MTEKNRPLVSIITPSLNQAGFIEEAILSVRDQDYPAIEHIVMDGGSTDGTIEILKRYDRDLTWSSEPDNGQSQAINKGFAAAAGDIVAWLNSDDLYLPGAVGSAVRVLTDNPQIGAVYGYALVIDEKENETDILTSPDFSRQTLYSRPNFIVQPTVFMRKSVLDQAGFLDERLHYVMDYELWLRLGRIADFKLIPEPLAAIRFHSQAKSVAKSADFWPELLSVYRKYDEIHVSPIYITLRRIRPLYWIWERLRSFRLIKLRDRLFKSRKI